MRRGGYRDCAGTTARRAVDVKETREAGKRVACGCSRNHAHCGALAGRHGVGLCGSDPATAPANPLVQGIRVAATDCMRWRIAAVAGEPGGMRPQ